MDRVASRLQRVATVLNYATIGVTDIVLVAATVLAFAGIVVRFGFNDSLPWGQELGAYLLVALTFLGMAPGLHDRSHPAIDVAIRRCPRWVQLTASTLISSITAILGGILIMTGVTAIAMLGDESAASFPMPLRYAYVAIPIAGVLFVVHGLTNSLEDIRSLTSLLSGARDSARASAPSPTPSGTAGR